MDRTDLKENTFKTVVLVYTFFFMLNAFFQISFLMVKYGFKELLIILLVKKSGDITMERECFILIGTPKAANQRDAQTKFL